MGRQKPRVRGPYSSPQRGAERWEVQAISADGTRRRRYFTKRADADAYVVEMRRALHGASVTDLVDRWEVSMQALGNKTKSRADQVWRVTSWLGSSVLAKAPHTLTRSTWERCLESCEGSVATRRAKVAASVAFVRWAVKAGEMSNSQLASIQEIEVHGKAGKGKPQLRIDEARQYTRYCMQLAPQERVGTLAPLLMGLRASEILNRIGRDLDDGGRLLWITGAKTQTSNRRVPVPECLRDAFLALRTGPNARILAGGCDGGRSKTWLRKLVKRACERAGVPVVCPHGLRGSYASLASEVQGVDLTSRLMGHATVRMTTDHYASKETLEASKARSVLRVIEG